MKRLFIGAALVAAAAAVGLAPQANADPNARYLGCLTEHGYYVYDAAAAVHVGVAIQNDERNGVPRQQLIYNLVNLWGFDRPMANVYIDCAWRTWRGTI
ncbi:DUF732 domain-containing protein [Mycobacterium conspicuum]|uniref:Uncharacterized protein n=1 Tax=Mycobacterium conspicuum TaxID=44010 RepID=A0A1X1TQ28_9MYCO|nr:DUF732 domain-containing protein [Mycobacterium conspicuum]ORV46623.1 hypothetical protein AWC00_02430 [Mycobacterium conspicuum]BBZ40156.1 hypothetical protein MCNS_32190 [Mycobacterium conspicuum]